MKNTWMQDNTSSKSIFQTIRQLLFFKITKEEFLNLDKRHFFVGLLGTWIVGMGRYWDDPRAEIGQLLGLGSVIYIFALALFIWLIVKPFKVPNWTYFTVLTFISLTSFPAIFYAIPVEKWASIDVARSLNVWFLFIVASWRLGLLFYFFKVFTGLRKLDIIVITLMPMCVIITALAILNLHQVVFNIMGGLREENAYDSAYFILVLLTGVSMIMVVPLLLLYIVGIVKARKSISSRTSNNSSPTKSNGNQ